MVMLETSGEDLVSAPLEPERQKYVRYHSLAKDRARGVASVFPSVAVVVLVAAPLQQMVSRRSIELLAVSTWLILE